MALTTTPNSLAQMLDKATPNNIATFLQILGLGRMVRQAMPATLRRQVPLIGTANPYTLTTVDSISLPDDAKAAYILKASVIAGGTTGEFTFKAPVGTTPTTGTCGIAPNGDITFVHTTDLVTLVDVVYLPEKVDAVEYTLSPASAIATIPVLGSGQLAVILMEAEILAGTNKGKCIVLAPGAAPGSTLQANLNVAKTTVLFATGDAPTSVRVKLGIMSAIDQNALLEAAAAVL